MRCHGSPGLPIPGARQTPPEGRRGRGESSPDLAPEIPGRAGEHVGGARLETVSVECSIEIKHLTPMRLTRISFRSWTRRRPIVAAASALGTFVT